MGYTHYWKHRGFTDSQWNDLTSEADRIIRSSAVPLAGGNGVKGTSPVINEEKVCFNGVEDDSHETFILTKRPQEFEFCKTALKPYDSVVVAIMQWAATVNPNFDPSSDGDPGVFKFDGGDVIRDYYHH